SFQLPADATLERTRDVVKKLDDHLATSPAIETSISIDGYGFSGSATNAALNFAVLKDWKQCGQASSVEEAMRAQHAMAGVTEGTVMSLLPPAIDELGTSSGFTLRLQDRANHGHAALKAAEAKLLELAARSKIVHGVYPDSLPAGTSVRLDIDRQKAEALGVPFASISDTLSTAMGSTYVNDFPSAGRMQQVIIQADAPSRMQLDNVLKLYVGNVNGGMVPLSEVVRPAWSETPLQLVRFQGYPSARLSGG
ncbi:multidrug efflux RND transporter permease subunit, partial [Pseudomonas sp. MWU13-2860]